MDILAESHKIFQSKILPTVGKRHQKLFSFGFEALSLMPFVSLHSNARMTLAKRCTAETKIYRLVSNKNILKYFPQLLPQLHLVQPGDKINVDFSTFCGFQVLTFAKQTSLGRAIPAYIAAITYPIENPGSQTQFIIKETKTFMRLLGFSVHLVFDRGFELPYLASSLVENHINFTIRMRKDKHVLYRKKDIPLRSLPWFENDCMVGIYGETLRVVRSEKKKGMEEPWYLLTNDTKSTRDKIMLIITSDLKLRRLSKTSNISLRLRSFTELPRNKHFLSFSGFTSLPCGLCGIFKQ